MNAKQLKDSILQFAVQGKLIPQDNKDEPSIKLIESIQNHRDKLVEEGIVKREKRLQPVSINEVPFDIPDSWEWVRLGNLVSIGRGSSPRPKGSPLYWSSLRTKYHWIKISDISKHSKENFLIDTDEFLTEEGTMYSVKVDEDFLITAASGSLGKVSKLGITGYIYDGLIYLNFKGIPLNKDYIMYYLRTIESFLKDVSTGTSWKNITTTILKELPVPIPPLEEQNRIVSKINELEKLITKYNILKSHLDHKISSFPSELESSILQYAMQGKLVDQDINEESAGELVKKISKEKENLIKQGIMKKDKIAQPIEEDYPFQVPDSWKWVRLREIGFIFSGGTPKTGEPTYWDSKGLIWITPSDMGKNKSMYISDSQRKISVKGLEQSSAQLIPKGSIVYSSRAPIGHINIVLCDFATNQGCKSIFPIFVDKEYVYYSLKYMTPWIQKKATGTTFKEISGTAFGETLIPLPPINEQRRIVNKIKKLLNVLENLK